MCVRELNFRCVINEILYIAITKGSKAVYGHRSIINVMEESDPCALRWP